MLNSLADGRDQVRFAVDAEVGEGGEEFEARRESFV